MSEGPSESVQKECECMRKRIVELEEERERQRKNIAAVEAERDEYLRAVYTLLKSQQSREECEQWGKQTLESWSKSEGSWFTFEEILGELEKATETNPCPTRARSELSTPTA